MALTRICSIPDCCKPAIARGWCFPHYQRWRRHGDPRGGQVRGAIRYYREVALSFEGDGCLIWPFWRDKDGYGRVKIDGENHPVHRLVCRETNGPPPTPQHEAAHSCGRGGDGCIAKRHLSWKTPKENNADKLIHGTINRGERHGRSKLTEMNVHEIRALKGKVTLAELAQRFGVHSVTICTIQRGKIWAWL